jgi:arsenate reductase
VERVIFACMHNAGRSQMAAAFFNALVDPTKAEAISAGTEPGPRVHPEVVTAMLEVGIDLSSARPSKLDAATVERADWLVTMGCGEACPTARHTRREDWPLEDPKGLPLERVRTIRDETRDRVERLIAAEHFGPGTSRSSQRKG